MSADNKTRPGTEAHTVVVIGRQFGSGGRKIGKMVAEKLGASYFDKELLAAAAESFGFAPSIFAGVDEKKPSLFRSLLQGMYGTPDNFHPSGLSGERLYEVQSRVISRLANQGPCVIVGRTADYIMRHHPDLVSVFLHAPIDWRANAVMERGDAKTLNEAVELAEKRDRQRQEYYNYFTGRNWGRADNYHLTIDSSKLTPEQTAELILAFTKAI